MKLSDITDLDSMPAGAGKHQLNRTQEFKKLLMDVAKFAPGRFEMNKDSYIAKWAQDPKVVIEVVKPYLNVAGKPMVEIDVWAHVREPLPRDLLNAFMSYVERQNVKLEKSQVNRDGGTWWVLKAKVPLERYSDEA